MHTLGFALACSPWRRKRFHQKCFILFGCAFIRPGPCLIDPRGRSKKKTPAQTLVSIYQTTQQPEGQEYSSTKMAEVQSDTLMTRKTHAIAQIKCWHPHITASVLLGWRCLEAPGSDKASVCKQESSVIIPLKPLQSHHCCPKRGAAAMSQVRSW